MCKSQTPAGSQSELELDEPQLEFKESKLESESKSDSDSEPQLDLELELGRELELGPDEEVA